MSNSSPAALAAAHKKIEVLEVKLAYQEDTIESLNQIVIKQQDKLAHLEKTLTYVIERLKSSAGSDQGINNEVELPPHY